ncbi:hypothetical protein LguiA_033828 [Lonicera macranthoides]
MFKSISLFSRKKSTRPFKEFYSEWISTLKNTLLPNLRHSISSLSALLSTHMQLIHAHFQLYYETLDSASQYDVAQLLYPLDFRTPIEIPFLWIGDLHPYLFTNLLRSFTQSIADDSKSADEFEFYDEVDEELAVRIEQIECGMRLMVPALAARFRNAQSVLIDKIGENWGNVGGELEIGEAMGAQMEELASVFMDANRLRRNVLAEIMAATDIYKGALFFESLSQFLIGFWDRKLLAEFKGSKNMYQLLNL